MSKELGEMIGLKEPFVVVNKSYYELLKNEHKRLKELLEESIEFIDQRYMDQYSKVSNYLELVTNRSEYFVDSGESENE